MHCKKTQSKYNLICYVNMLSTIIFLVLSLNYIYLLKTKFAIFDH